MKDILVIVTGGVYDESRLVSATGIAKTFDAHVTVAIVNELPDPQLYPTDPSIGIAPIDTELRDDALKRGEELRDRTVRRLSELSSSASVVLINEFRAHAGDALCELARLSDLFVATLPTESTKAELMKGAIDKVLVEGACCVLCLSHGTATTAAAKHAVLAWNGSREAARALNASLPLLQQAQKVTVLLVDQSLRRAGEVSRPGDEVLVRLKRHGIEAELVRVASEGLKTADAIIAEVRRLGADLLVMGAQAEGGLRQWFQSSVSRKVLADAKIPLLIAH